MVTSTGIPKSAFIPKKLQESSESIKGFEAIRRKKRDGLWAHTTDELFPDD